MNKRKKKTVFASMYGDEPVLVKAGGVELIKLFNWYHTTATPDDRVDWLQTYAKEHLDFAPRQLKVLASNSNNIPNTISSLARAFMAGTTFADKDRVVRLIKDACMAAVTMSHNDSDDDSEVDTVKKLAATIKDDRAAASVYWGLQDQVDKVVKGARAVKIDTSVLDKHWLSTKQISRVKESFLREFREFQHADKDGEGYEGLHIKAAIKFLRSIVDALDQRRAVSKVVRRTRKVRIRKPEKIVGKLKFLPILGDMKSVPVTNILSSKILYAYDTKTRDLIQFKATSDVLAVKEGRVIGSVTKKKLRKPDDVLKIVRSSTEKRIDRLWNELTTKASDHSGLLNNRCLLVRAIGM